jgi:hypothetical protein
MNELTLLRDMGLAVTLVDGEHIKLSGLNKLTPSKKESALSLARKAKASIMEQLKQPPKRATVWPDDLPRLAGFSDVDLFRQHISGHLIPCPRCNWWWVYKKDCGQCSGHEQCVADLCTSEQGRVLS